jgi:ankyrin repeat protein
MSLRFQVQQTLTRPVDPSTSEMYETNPIGTPDHFATKEACKSWGVETALSALQQMYAVSTSANELRPALFPFERFDLETISSSISKKHSDELKLLEVISYSISNNHLTLESGSNIIEWLREKKHLRSLTRLISMRGPTIDALVEKLFPILVEVDDVQLMRIFLKRGVPRDIIDHDTKQGSPLCIACSHGNLEMVQALLSAGADANKPIVIRAKKKRSPLAIAIKSVSRSAPINIPLVKLLLSHGADVDGKVPNGYGVSTLKQALKRGDELLLDILLQNGAQFDSMSEEEFGPLATAVKAARGVGEEQSIKMLQVLFDAGYGTVDHPGQPSPLSYAADQGALRLFNFLVEWGVQPDGQTLTHSLRGQDIEIVEWTLEHINEVAEDSIRPMLSILIDLEDLEMFELVLDSKHVSFTLDNLLDGLADTVYTHWDEPIPLLLDELECYAPLPDSTEKTLTRIIQNAVSSGNIFCLEIVRLGDPERFQPLIAAIQLKDRTLISDMLENDEPINTQNTLEDRQWRKHREFRREYRCKKSEYDHERRRGSDVEDQEVRLASVRFWAAPIEAAAAWGDHATVKRLLEMGADPRLSGALIQAIWNDDYELVRMLLDFGSSVHSWPSDYAESPLQAAVSTGNASLVQILLDHQADPQQTAGKRGSTSEGWSGPRPLTPLSMAIWDGRFDLLSMLVDAGACVNITQGDDAGIESPLACAARSKEQFLKGHGKRHFASGDELKIIDYLLFHGANPDDDRALEHSVTRRDIVLTGHLLRARSQQYLSCRRGYGCQALLYAVELQLSETVDLLLSYGVDTNMLKWEGTCMGVALGLKRSPARAILVKSLLSAKADPNMIATTVTDGCWDSTPLLMAIDDQDRETIEMLIQHGADVNLPAKGRLRRTPLQAACDRGFFEAVKLLLSHGAQVNADPAFRDGATALQFAAIGGHIDIAMLLLEQGADVNSVASKVDGRTALEGAAEHGRIDMLSLLVNAGAWTDGPGSGQYARALELAAKNGHFVAKKHLESLAARHE